MLLVKGDREAAKAAAKSHNISTVFHGTDRDIETILHCSEEHHDAIAKWYRERAEIKQGYGYPDGTLLYYILRECEAKV